VRGVLGVTYLHVSSTGKALEVLKEKDVLFQTPEGYIVYDRFLNLWLKRTFV